MAAAEVAETGRRAAFYLTAMPDHLCPYGL